MIQHLLTEPSIVSRELQYSVPDKSQQDKSSLWWYISVAAGSFPSHSKHAEQLGAVPPFPDEPPPSSTRISDSAGANSKQDIVLLEQS